MAWLEPFGHYIERESLYQRAFSVAPNDPATLRGFAEFLLQVGRCELATHYGKGAYDVDSLNAQVAISYATDIGLGLGSFVEAMDIYDRLLTLWPKSKHVCLSALWNSLWMCAHSKDWNRFDLLARRLSAIEADGRLGEHPRLLGDMLRDPSTATRSRTFEYLRESLERDGTIQLVLLVVAYRIGLKDETFDLIERASFSHMFDPQGAPPSGLGNPGIIFERGANQLMMRDIRFVGLCSKLGLCDYWIKTDRWPDCSDETPYDFKAEVRRLVAARGTHSGAQSTITHRHST